MPEIGRIDQSATVETRIRTIVRASHAWAGLPRDRDLQIQVGEDAQPVEQQARRKEALSGPLLARAAQLPAELGVLQDLGRPLGRLVRRGVEVAVLPVDDL